MTKQYDFYHDKPLTAYVADVSYFSGKLEAYLRYKEIPYKRRPANVNTMLNEVYANTGMMKMPAVRLHDGKWLKDTTPMLQWFDQQKPAYSIYPEDPVTNFIALLIEDYADEWCWRSALYWRWCFPETRALLGNRIGQEILGDWPIPNRLAGWYIGERQIRTYLKGDGLTKKTEPFVKNHYLEMLESMQGILSDSPYLLGAKPSIADFGLFGPMFRHFGLDPAPAKVMIEKAPAVYEWLARLWNERGSAIDDGHSFNDFGHPGWQYFFNEIIDVYVPFLKANANAWANGHKRFDLVTPAVTYPKLRMVHYRVYCLEMLQQRFNALSVGDKEKVRAIFSQAGTQKKGVFDLGIDIQSGLSQEFAFPINPTTRRIGTLEKFVLTATGTPWDMPAWLKRKSG